MPEAAGTPDEDPMMRYLREIAGSMGTNDTTANDGLYAEALRAEAAAIVESLPTRENPIRGTDISDLAATVGGIAYAVLDARIMHAIADGYTTPDAPRGAPSLESDEAGPRERTPGGLCSYAANHPLLRDRDAAAQSANRGVNEHAGDLNDRGVAMRERSNAEMQAMAGALGLYGVERADMHFIPSHNAVTFNYRGNTVRMSTLNGVTEITAWDARLTDEQGEKLWDDHEYLVKQGAHLAHLNHYLQRGAVPPSLAHLAKQIEADGGNITEAFNKHAQDVREHALSGGYRSFQVHTPNLRWSVPVALHLLEQPHDTAYDMVGDYSATNGFIRVDEPGTFTRVHSGDHTWRVGEDGLIQ